MDATIEDALVEWYEAERLARAGGAEFKRGDVVEFESMRSRQNPALVRLFVAIEQTMANMSLLKPVAAVDRPAHPVLRLVNCVHAHA